MQFSIPITEALGEYKPVYRSFNYFIWSKVTKDEEFKIIFDQKIWNSKDENCPSDEQLKDVDARLNIKRRSLNPKKNDNKPTALMYFDGTTRFWRFNRKVDGVDRAPKTFLNDEDVYLKCEDLSKSKSKKVTWLLNDMGQPEVKVNEFEIEEGRNMEETPFQTPNNPKTAEEKAQKAAKKWQKKAQQGRNPPPREGKSPTLPPKNPSPLPPKREGKPNLDLPPLEEPSWQPPKDEKKKGDPPKDKKKKKPKDEKKKN